MSQEARRTPRARPGRSGILKVAIGLFAGQGVAGTSLQHIADAAGVTKAAVYHHFQAKEDILTAALAPAIASLESIVRNARAHSSAASRTEDTIAGLADQAVQHRHIWSVLLKDSSVTESLRTDPEHEKLFDELHALLEGDQAAESARIRTATFLSGLVGPLIDPRCRDLSDDALRAGILESGRRLLL
ncbi:TetR family transcriptional regulator [Stackebrandtia endophytica]|uniref:TetR family transcriptional regulator n=1 Tax=Stackebrandtia endophytica TaxID=1496996 RepID=A0A543ASC2_9ACTN|nr:TetR family transcriptional regulator [Stackebrandtia endophytica]TQL75405.1 TetR family transcriptional regulator [Stackebrandtia endophytica]